MIEKSSLIVKICHVIFNNIVSNTIVVMISTYLYCMYSMLSSFSIASSLKKYTLLKIQIYVYMYSNVLCKILFKCLSPQVIGQAFLNAFRQAESFLNKAISHMPGALCGGHRVIGVTKSIYTKYSRFSQVLLSLFVLKTREIGNKIQDSSPLVANCYG